MEPWMWVAYIGFPCVIAGWSWIFTRPRKRPPTRR